MRNFYRIHPLKQYYAVKVSHKIKVRIMLDYCQKAH